MSTKIMKTPETDSLTRECGQAVPAKLFIRSRLDRKTGPPAVTP
ncbi:MAG TPA: hypothetical protein VGK00_07900 [Anaerolineales bacterium]|jgi:hypothetical protein